MKFKYLAKWILLGAASCLFFAPNGYSNSQSSNPASIEDLILLTQSSGAQSVTELVGRLPESYRSSYTLMYASNSVQEAGPDAPRVLLYGPDAKLVLAFNGKPDQVNFEELEAMQFNSSSKRFEFFSLRFNPQGKLLISEKNPALCLRCHGLTDPRPIWESYDQWKGAYGENDDTPPSDPTLNQQFVQFLKSAPKDPRYQKLIGLENHYSVEEEGFQGGSYPEIPQFKVPTNSILSQELSEWNFERLARIIQSHSEYASLKYALVASIWCGQKWNEFFPPHFSRTIPEGITGSIFGIINPNAFQFLFPAEKVMSSWTMQIYSHETGLAFATPGQSAWEFTAKLVAGDEDLLPYFEVESAENLGQTRGLAHPRSSDAEFCQQMKNLSLDSLDHSGF